MCWMQKAATPTWRLLVAPGRSLAFRYLCTLGSSSPLDCDCLPEACRSRDPLHLAVGASPDSIQAFRELDAVAQVPTRPPLPRSPHPRISSSTLPRTKVSPVQHGNRSRALGSSNKFEFVVQLAQAVERALFPLGRHQRAEIHPRSKLQSRAVNTRCRGKERRHRFQLRGPAGVLQQVSLCLQAPPAGRPNVLPPQLPHTLGQPTPLLLGSPSQCLVHHHPIRVLGRRARGETDLEQKP